MNTSAFFSIGAKTQRLKTTVRISICFFLLPLLFGCREKDDFSFEFHAEMAHTVSITYNEGGGETQRRYLFNTEGGTEWVILDPEGFYDASHNGAKLVNIKTANAVYNLEQFSESLYRPGFFIDDPSAKRGPDYYAPGIEKDSAGLYAILAREKTAPSVYAALTEGTIKITVTDEGGGAGLLAVYQTGNYGEYPAAILNVNDSAKKTYTQKGKNYYELELPLAEMPAGPGFIISAFNADNTMESTRVNIFTGTNFLIAEQASAHKPALHLVSMNSVMSDSLTPHLAGQENGDLYSAVRIHEAAGLSGIRNEATGQITAGDILLLFLPGPSGIDHNGDFIFSGAENFGKWELLETLTVTRARRVIVFIGQNELTAGSDAAFTRLRKRMGPETMVFVLPDSFFAENNFRELLNSSPAGGREFLKAADISELAAAYSSVQYPIIDFNLLDLKVFAPAVAAVSGSWSVSRVSALDAGRFASLSGFGVMIGELNPRNYSRIDANAMISMGMEPHYVSLLEGIKLYEAGDYPRAITECTKAINLKQDYADAYAWRGNAYRRNGDSARAIDDYGRALRYNSNYTEVYNYRGFLYDQMGDYDRAIDDYTRAIRLRADYADALFNRGYTYGKKGDYSRAIADYTQVIRLESNNAAAYIERGRAYEKSGNTIRADADFAAAQNLTRQ